MRPKMLQCGSFSMMRFIIFALFLETVAGSLAKSFFIHWNSTNSIFRIDNTDHIFDLNKGNSNSDFDQINIICPLYEAGVVPANAERYIIYNVSKEEYDTCRITDPNPRTIAVCDKPYKLLFFTVTFRPFSPIPGGLEFLPGRDYYFISTSSKDDQYRRIGGSCATHNMRLIFRVCCNPYESKTIPPTYAPPYIPPQPPPVVTIPPTPSRGVVTQHTNVNTNNNKPTKKTHSTKQDKAPNEVVKSEELSYSRSHRSCLLSFVPLIIVAIMLPRALTVPPR